MEEKHIQKIIINNKEITLIGTAHVSKDSALEVRKTIEEVNPDSICIELDQERYQSLNNPKKWDDTNIIDVIKKKQAFLLLVNIILGAYQRKMATKFDSEVGKEMAEAISISKEKNINLVLADRNIQTTFKRIWRKHSLKEKIKIITALLATDDSDDISEEDIKNMMSGDVLDEALKDISSQFPTIYDVLVVERNKYLSQKIKNAKGDKIVAVVGAAHLPGILEEIEKDYDINQFEIVPEKTKTEKIKTWILPITLLLVFILSFFKDTNVGVTQLKSWFLFHGIFSALGCALCLANPLTILTAFISSPFTALNPLLSAGLFAGIVEALIKKPTVSDFKNIYDDCSSLKGILKNRVTRILVIVLITNLFSSLATFISSFDIIKNLFVL